MSTTSPCRFVIACPRRMAIPKYDSTPQIFENSRGWSTETIVSSHTDSFCSSVQCTSEGRRSRDRRTWS